MATLVKKQNTVRINAGKWRSRLLKFVPSEGLRPTPERVRQTVFNWLGQDLTNRACLDLFAGTGALGFEAASRNAKSVMMVELNQSVVKSLKQNQAMLVADNCQIINSHVMEFLASNQQQFDVIFCDPPYQKKWLEKILPVVGKHLMGDGVLYAEAEYEINPSDSWKVFKKSKAGGVYYHLLKYT